MREKCIERVLVGEGLPGIAVLYHAICCYIVAKISIILLIN